MRPRWQALVLVSTLLGGAATIAPATESAAYWFALGQLLSAEGQVDEALDAFGRAVAAAPDEPVVRIERAELLLRLGRLELAAVDAAEAQRLAPDEPDALRLRGRIEMLRAERNPAAFRAAIEVFERLVEVDGQDVEALASLGQLRLAEGNPALAIDPLAEALRLRPGQPTLEALLSRALAAAGRAAEAEGHQRTLLEAHPRQLGPRLELVDELARQGRSAEAVDLLRGAPKDQQEIAEVRRRLAHQLYLAGELGAARVTALDLVASDPGFGGGRVLLGLIDLATGEFDAAARWLEPIATAAPENEQIGDLYLRAVEGLGRVEDALSLLERREAALRSVGKSEDADRARLERALVLVRAARWDQLGELAEELRLEADPRLQEQGTLLRAESLAAVGEAQRALALLDGADAEHPNLLVRRIELLFDAGRKQEAEQGLTDLRSEVADGELRAVELLQRRGDFERSVPILEALRRRDEGSIAIAYRLGSAYERLGQIPEAVELLREIVDRAPDFAPALNYLGYLWIDRDENLDEAIEMVRRAVRLDPDNGAYVDSLGWGYFRRGRILRGGDAARAGRAPRWRRSDRARASRRCPARGRGSERGARRLPACRGERSGSRVGRRETGPPRGRLLKSRQRALLSVALLSCSCLSIGCRSAPRAGAGAGAALAGVAVGAAGEQHLFRVEVVRKGALDPSFRLVLRLGRPDRFELAATDPFGRGLWRVGVDGAMGSFVDDRERWSCHFDPRRPDALPRLDWGLAAFDLPPVLLGRLPLSAELADRASGSGDVAVEDGLGRRWRVEMDGEGVVELGPRQPCRDGQLPSRGARGDSLRRGSRDEGAVARARCRESGGASAAARRGAPRRGRVRRCRRFVASPRSISTWRSFVLARTVSMSSARSSPPSTSRMRSRSSRRAPASRSRSRDRACPSMAPISCSGPRSLSSRNGEGSTGSG